jgi:hypothetical protein
MRCRDRAHHEAGRPIALRGALPRASARYPHHYFNATHQGLRRLFEDFLQVESVVVPHVGHPAFALHWILNSWAAGLPPDAREAFLNQRIGDLPQGSPHAMAGQSFAALSEEKKRELACGFLLSARK